MVPDLHRRPPIREATRDERKESMANKGIKFILCALLCLSPACGDPSNDLATSESSISLNWIGLGMQAFEDGTIVWAFKHPTAGVVIFSPGATEVEAYLNFGGVTTN